jgi:hypothetical protein
MGRCHRTFLPRFKVGCRFCGRFSRTRVFAKRRGPLYGSYPAFGNRRQNAPDESHGPLPTDHCLPQGRPQRGCGARTRLIPADLRKGPKRTAWPRTTTATATSTTVARSSGGRLLLKFHEGLETKFIFAFLNAIELIRTEIFESLFRTARPRDLQLINLLC